MRKQQESEHLQADVLVVGGGLAGLAAANYLARAGYSVTLCEGAAGPGGRAVTRVNSGFRFNMGPHALYRGGEGVRVLKELGVDYSGGAPLGEGAWLTREGRRWPLPGGALALLTSSLFTLRERARALRFFSGLPRVDTDALQGVSLDDWLFAEGYTGNVASVIRTLVRLSTYCDASDRLSAGAGLAQLRLGLGGVLYLDGGWQRLVDALVHNAEKQGVSIRCGTGVKKVESDPDGVRVELSGGGTAYAKAVVLAVSPEKAMEVLGSNAGGRLAAFVRWAEPVKAACLDVGLGGLPEPATAFALDLDRPYYYSVHSMKAGLAPVGGHLLQLACYGGDDDGQARTELASWLDDLQPGWRDTVVVERYLRRATVMNAMPRADQDGLRGRPGPGESGLPGVYLCGDWVGPTGLLSDASLASARQAVQELIARTTEVAA